ncbi:MAG TPA: glycosyltransferase family 2 protein [Gemmatimonadaceae bacterium]|jgi:glycosyltransferase involved in cell wall biosynthesis
MTERFAGASLIIATYNWKEALALVLASVRSQATLPGEVLVADDGSRDDTRELVAREAATFPVRLLHCWQEDRGFRKGRILNEAMARAAGEYLIAIDGDMLLHPAFVRSHMRFARRGRYIQGSRMMLGERATAHTFRAGRLAAGPLSADVRNRVNGIHAPFLSMFSRGERGPIYRTRGCNISFWRDDILRVNGYNEDMEGWGREDTELVARLMNSGVRRRNLKFAAVSYHLHHPARPTDSDAANLELALKVVRDGVTRCEHGIDRHLRAA